jgi:hypothetical protein
LIRLFFLIIILTLAGCATVAPPPHNKENVKEIFHQYPHWYHAAKKTEAKWGVSVPVQMAIIYYESAFKGDAKPPRKYLLGFIPWKHITSAYGYAQALNGTWDDYLAYTGNSSAKRSRFESATDFIGWYSALAKERLGIPADDPYRLYLAYHEGLGGFEKKTYQRKPWLMRIAKNVALKSQIYQRQLAALEQNQFPPQRFEEQLQDIDIPDLELEPPWICLNQCNNF